MGVTCWPEKVQYFVQTHATPRAIHDACARVQTMKQLSTETEIKYSTRLNEAVYRYGNVHIEIEKMTYLINGLHLSTQSIVTRYRESQPRRYLILSQLVQFARDEGEAFRAQARVTSNLFPLPRNVDTPALNVILNSVEEPESGALFVLEQGGTIPDLICTDALTFGEEEEQVAYIETGQTASSQCTARKGTTGRNPLPINLTPRRRRSLVLTVQIGPHQFVLVVTNLVIFRPTVRITLLRNPRRLLATTMS